MLFVPHDFRIYKFRYQHELVSFSVLFKRPLGVPLKGIILMRRFVFTVLLLTVLSKVFAQQEDRPVSYELLGSINYAYSATKSERKLDSYLSIEETHSITVQPSCGYFLTDHFELLMDLSYTLYFLHDNDASMEMWAHRIGIKGGIVYNYQWNSSYSTYIGSKIGISWWREISKQQDYYSDSRWSGREISFPIILIGNRFTFNNDWSILLIIEYSDTKPYKPNPFWTTHIEKVSFFFGFSVFI
jgi:hypothetical protein